MGFRALLEKLISLAGVAKVRGSQGGVAGGGVAIPDFGGSRSGENLAGGSHGGVAILIWRNLEARGSQSGVSHADFEEFGAQG